MKFLRCFHHAVTLTNGKHCNLKSHYSGALREVIGYLELQARRNPDRFVYVTVEDIADHCHRFKKPDHKYKARWITEALAELRRRGIISRRIRRCFGAVAGVAGTGMLREGFYVAPHDALTVEEDGYCCFKGFDADRRRDWWNHKYHYFDRITIEEPDPQFDAVQNAYRNAVSSAVPNAVSSAVSHSGDVADAAKVNDENCALAVVRQPLEPKEPIEPSEPTDKVQSAPSALGSLLNSPLTDKSEEHLTFGEYFTAVTDIIATITDAEYDIDSTEQYCYRDTLKDCCSEAVEQLADERFLGRESCARVMGLAMKILRDKHGAAVPKPWLPTMKLLRATKGTARFHHLATLKKPSPPLGWPKCDEWHRANGYEPCEDFVYRSKADRDALGFAVKNDDGVWMKQNANAVKVAGR